MAEIITTGKTVDEAIDEGCRLLGASRAEVSIEIIDQPVKKLFRTIPAKVKITKSEFDIDVKDILTGMGGYDEAPKKEEKKKVKENAEKANKKTEKTVKEQSSPAKANDAATAEEVTESEPKQENKPKKKKKKKNNKPASEKKEVSEENSEKKEETSKNEEEASDSASEILGYLTEEELPERAVKAFGYLKEIIGALGYEKVEYTFGKTERGVRFILSGDDAPSLIGRRGETMDALQYLCTVGSSRDGGEYCRISLDIEGYRSRREEALTELAAKTAAKVKKNHHSQTLEPMNPYERRIVHAAVQEIEGVTSHSVGSEPYRKVVITLEGASGERRNGNRRNTKKSYDRTDETRSEAPAAEKKMQNPIPVKKELKSQEEFVGALYSKIEL